MENQKIDNLAILPKQVRCHIYTTARNNYRKYINGNKIIATGMCYFIKYAIVDGDFNKSFISDKSRKSIQSINNYTFSYSLIETLPEFKSILVRYKYDIMKSMYMFPPSNTRDRIMLFNEMIKNTK